MDMHIDLSFDDIEASLPFLPGTFPPMEEGRSNVESYLHFDVEGGNGGNRDAAWVEVRCNDMSETDIGNDFSADMTPISVISSSTSIPDGFPKSANIDIPQVPRGSKEGNSETSSLSADDRMARQTPDQKRKAPVKWSQDEEERFIEALQLYGRDWKKCAQHVGTRDANNFRSHAQKYFIRLYKHGLPVPAKVSETGAGHTLSGKPLDPNSAAARCYLNGRSYRSDLAKRHGRNLTKTSRSVA